MTAFGKKFHCGNCNCYQTVWRTVPNSEKGKGRWWL